MFVQAVRWVSLDVARYPTTLDPSAHGDHYVTQHYPIPNDFVGAVTNADLAPVLFAGWRKKGDRTPIAWQPVDWPIHGAAS